MIYGFLPRMLFERETVMTCNLKERGFQKWKIRFFLGSSSRECREPLHHDFEDENKHFDINLIADCNSVAFNDTLYGLSIMIGIKLLPRRSQQLQQQHSFVIRSLHFFLICCEACRIGMSSIKVKSFQLPALFIRLTWHRQDSTRLETSACIPWR